MIPATLTPVPAAWYTDPEDPRLLRYWDGITWTRQVAADPDPFVPTAPEPTPASWTPLPADPGDSSALQPSGPSYVPMARPAATSASSARPRVSGPSSTVASWFGALLPLGLVPALLSGAIDAPISPSTAVVPAIAGVMLAAMVVLAMLDRRGLQRRGVLDTPHPALALVPVAFAVSRAVTVGRSGAGVLLVSLLTQGIVAAVLVGAILPTLGA